MPNIHGVNVDGVLYDLAVNNSVFVVNYNNGTGDKTFEEINEAHSSGLFVVCINSENEIFTLSKDDWDNGTFNFINTDIVDSSYIVCNRLTVNYSDVWMYESVLSIISLQEDKTLYVDATNGSDTNSGTQSSPLRTIQAAIDLIPKNIGKYDVTINVAPGRYTDYVEIENFIGSGSVVINGSGPGVNLSRNAFLTNCRCSVVLSLLNFSGNVGITVTNCDSVHFSALDITGAGDTGYGIRVEGTKDFQISGSTLSNVRTGIIILSSFAWISATRFSYMTIAVSAKSSSGVSGIVKFDSNNTYTNVTTEFEGPILVEFTDQDDGDIIIS